jgi:hypothetical protein
VEEALSLEAVGRQLETVFQRSGITSVAGEAAGGTWVSIS